MRIHPLLSLYLVLTLAACGSTVGRAAGGQGGGGGGDDGAAGQQGGDADGDGDGNAGGGDAAGNGGANDDGGANDGGNEEGGNDDGDNNDGADDGGNDDGGNDDGGDDDGNDDGGDDDGGNDGGNDDGGGDDGGDDGGAEGACINDQDEAVLAESDPRDATTNCAFGCIMQPDDQKQQCFRECLQEEMDLTDGCADCFADITLCVFDSCLPGCMNPEGAECVACMEEAGCNAAFAECSGLDPTDEE